MTDEPPLHELPEQVARGEVDRETLYENAPSEFSEDALDAMVERAEERLNRTEFDRAVTVAEATDPDMVGVPEDPPDDAMEFLEAYPWEDDTLDQLSSVYENWADEPPEHRWAFCWVHDNARRDVNDFFNVDEQ